MVYNPPQLDRTFSDELASRLAREYTKECVESLVEHMRDRANPTTSLVATNALLDRAYGKPKEIKMLSGDGGEKTPAYRIKIEFVDTIDASPKMKSPDVAPQPVFEEN
jgi:hypothetical protein